MALSLAGEGPRGSRRGAKGSCGTPAPPPPGPPRASSPGPTWNWMALRSAPSLPGLCIDEGALSFATGISCTHRYSPYIRDCGRENGGKPSSTPAAPRSPWRSHSCSSRSRRCAPGVRPHCRFRKRH
jgi:hypothetical protein